MLKYYITFLFRQFTKTLNRFCFTYVGQTKTWKLACQFDLRNSKVKSTFEVLSLDNILIKWHYLKNVRYQVWWKLLGVAAQFLLDCYLQWNGYSEKFYFENLHVFKASSCRGNIVAFWNDIACMVNSFLVSLDIPIMIIIL